MAVAGNVRPGVISKAIDDCIGSCILANETGHEIAKPFNDATIGRDGPG
jgi:hypothetical protein